MKLKFGKIDFLLWRKGIAMCQEVRFLVRYMGDNDYDDKELSREGILDIISEDAGDFRFTDDWKDSVWAGIYRIEVGEEYEVYGQSEYEDFKVFTTKRII